MASIRLRWRVEGGSPDSFRVERSRDAGATFSSVATPLATATYQRNSKVHEYVVADAEAKDIYRVVPVSGADDGEPDVTVVPPGGPSKAFILGFMVNVAGIPCEGERVVVDVAPLKAARLVNASDAFAVSQGKVGRSSIHTVYAYVDSSGMWKVEVARGTICRVTIPAQNIVRYVRVPDAQGPFDLDALEGVQGGHQYALWPDTTGEPPQPR